MISRIEGEVVGVGNGRADIKVGPLTIEVLIAGADEDVLSEQMGRPVTFYTLAHLESHGQGATYIPRLIGFLSEQDRAFFQVFTTVKGLGPRKALRALQMPFADIAYAIAAKDISLLKTLPEIGKRTAESIVAELHGKVDRFIEVKPIEAAVGEGAAAGAGTRRALMQDAVMVLTQLGEPAIHARQLVERALHADPTLATPDALVAAAFRLKEAV